MARENSIPPDQLARQRMLEAEESAQERAGKRASHENQVRESSSSVPPQHTQRERSGTQARRDD